MGIPADGEPSWGQTAYSGFRADVSSTEEIVHGALPSWNQLASLERAHWEAAAGAVLTRQCGQ